MKKKRGLKRYFKNLTTQNELKKMMWLKTDDPNSWTPNFHIHFDQLGYGTNSFKKRKPHLDKLFRHFKYLAVESDSSPADFQLYAILLDKSSSSDALFVHRPNPNNNQFPFKIEDLSKESTLTNKDLQLYLDALSEYDKLYGIVNEAFCLVVKQGVGEPL